MSMITPLLAAAFAKNFKDRTMEAITKYKMDLAYFDDSVVPLWHYDREVCRRNRYKGATPGFKELKKAGFAPLKRLEQVKDMPAVWVCAQTRAE